MTLARLIEAVEAGTLDPTDDWDFLRGLFPRSQAEIDAGDYESDEVADIRESFNGSLDAAKRLHDALLPGWWATLRYSTRPLVTVGDVDDEFRAQDDCLSRAWLLAILRAMEGR